MPTPEPPSAPKPEAHTQNAAMPKTVPPATIQEFFAQPQAPNPSAFLRTLCKGVVPIPTSEGLHNIITTTNHETVLVPRLLGLLQSLDLATESIKESILSLAEYLFHQKGILPTVSNDTAPHDCQQIALRLFSGDGAKAKKSKPELFGVFLLLAYHRSWIGPADAVALLQRVFFQPKADKKQKNRTEPVRSPNPERLILNAPLKHGYLAPFLKIHSEWGARHAGLELLSRTQEATISKLRDTVSSLQSELDNAREQIASLEQIIEGKDALIASLRQQITDSTTASQHRYDAIKARLRGFMEGELTRWLQNAAEAADADPPYLPVVQQRLRSALNGIQNELQWLSSD